MFKFIEKLKDKWLRTEPDPVFASIIDNIINLVNNNYYFSTYFSAGDLYLNAADASVEIIKFHYSGEICINFYNIRNDDCGLFKHDRKRAYFSSTAGNKAVLKHLEDLMNEKDRIIQKEKEKKQAGMPKSILESLEILSKEVQNPKTLDN